MRRLGAVAVFLALLATTAVPSSLAQKYEIMPYLGYRWGGAFKGAQYVEGGNVRAADLEIEGGGSYGLLGSIALVPGINLEILYERQSSELTLYSVTLMERVTLSDIDVDYFQVGLLYEFYQIEEQKIRPFLEITLGGTRFDPKEGIEGETRFSGGFAFGAKAFLNEHFGARLQTRFISTPVSAGSDLFCGGDGGCYFYPGNIYMNQIDISGGIIIAF